MCSFRWPFPLRCASLERGYSYSVWAATAVCPHSAQTLLRWEYEPSVCTTQGNTMLQVHYAPLYAEFYSISRTPRYAGHRFHDSILVQSRSGTAPVAPGFQQPSLTKAVVLSSLKTAASGNPCEARGTGRVHHSALMSWYATLSQCQLNGRTQPQTTKCMSVFSGRMR
jgi:hypothetical protein